MTCCVRYDDLSLTHSLCDATVHWRLFHRASTTRPRAVRGFEPAKILYSGPTRKPDLEAAFSEGPLAVSLEYVDLPTLLAQSDFVSLHNPLTDETRGMIGAAQFKLMKPTAVLINTSRAPVIDQDALVEALAAGEIAAAGTDVPDPEPLPPDSPLLRIPNLVVLPHIGSATEATREAMGECAVTNLLEGTHGRDLLHTV